MRLVPVFKRAPRTHMHVRAPIVLGIVVLLVVVLSSFCYYRLIAPVPRAGAPAPETRGALPPPNPAAPPSPSLPR